MQNWKFQYFLIFWSREYFILHPGKVKTVANNNNIFTFIQRTIITMPTTWLQIPCPLTNKKIIFNDKSKTEIQ